MINGEYARNIGDRGRQAASTSSEYRQVSGPAQPVAVGQHGQEWQSGWRGVLIRLIARLRRRRRTAGRPLSAVFSLHRYSVSLLKGLAAVCQSKMPAGKAGSTKEVANALSHSGDVDTSTVTVRSKLVSVGTGLPSLPKKMVDRIISGQYVDFSELPPAKGRARPLPNAEDGHIIVIRAGTTKLIPDLATWLQCFAVYMAVVTEHDTGRTKSLLAYLSTIPKVSAKYSLPSWVVYDQNIQQEDSRRMNWSEVEPSIYTQCFTNASMSSENWCKVCQSIDQGSDACQM